MFKKLFGWRSPRRHSWGIDGPAHTHQLPADSEEDGFVLIGESAIERSTVLTNHTLLNDFDAPPSYESQVLRDPSLPAYHLVQFSSLNMGQRSSNQVTMESSPEYVAAPLDISGKGSGHINTERPDLPMYRPDTYHNQPRTRRSPPSSYHEDARSVVSTLPGEILCEEDLRTTAQTPHLAYLTAVTDVPFQLASWLEATNWDFSGYDYMTIPNINISEYHYDFSVEKSTIRDYKQLVREP